MQRIAVARKPQALPREAPASRRLLKDSEVEAQYGISRFTLRADRIHARKFKFIKIGGGVYYRIEDIESTLNTHVIAGNIG